MAWVTCGQSLFKPTFYSGKASKSNQTNQPSKQYKCLKAHFVERQDAQKMPVGNAGWH